MVANRTRTSASGLIVVCLLSIGSGAVPAFGEVRFNRDVRTILSENCWRCHGFDAKQRQAGLRLDVREEAIRPADSGLTAIVPGKPDQSELVSRIAAQDESLRMPPPDAHQQLSRSQIETLRNWIADGAAYERHWAFEPIAKPPVPAAVGAWNPI
ncbi:MAG: c-type cytochrome domain-containing protein, partial [Maioricimonas sp. JB049]